MSLPLGVTEFYAASLSQQTLSVNGRTAGHAVSAATPWVSQQHEGSTEKAHSRARLRSVRRAHLPGRHCSPLTWSGLRGQGDSAGGDSPSLLLLSELGFRGAAARQWVAGGCVLHKNERTSEFSMCPLHFPTAFLTVFDTRVLPCSASCSCILAGVSFWQEQLVAGSFHATRIRLLFCCSRLEPAIHLKGSLETSLLWCGCDTWLVAGLWKGNLKFYGWSFHVIKSYWKANTGMRKILNSSVA